MGYNPGNQARASRIHAGTARPACGKSTWDRNNNSTSPKRTRKSRRPPQGKELVANLRLSSNPENSDVEASGSTAPKVAPAKPKQTDNSTLAKPASNQA